MGRYPLLARLADSGPQQAAQLAHAFGLNRSTVGRHLARLDAAGLVQRTDDPAHTPRPPFAVTTAGYAALEKARGTRMSPLRAQLETWPAADQRELLRLLRNLNRDLDARGAGSRARQSARGAKRG